MAFRFNRRLRVAPGITLNFGKRGVSTSVGPTGAKVTVGKKGVRSTVGLPGTGLSYTEVARKPSDASSAHRNEIPTWVGVLIAIGVGAFLIIRFLLTGQ